MQSYVSYSQVNSQLLFTSHNTIAYIIVGTNSYKMAAELNEAVIHAQTQTQIGLALPMFTMYNELVKYRYGIKNLIFFKV